MRFWVVLLAFGAFAQALASVPKQHCAYHLDVGRLMAEHLTANTGMAKMYTPYRYDDVLQVPPHQLAPPFFALESPLQVTKVIRFETDHALWLKAHSADHAHLEFSDLVGRRYRYHRIRLRSMPTAYVLDSATAGGRGSLPAHPPAPIPQDFELPADLEAFATELAERHMADSTTYQDLADGPEKRAMLAAQRSVVRQMLELVKVGRAPLEADMSRWNRELVRVVPAATDDDAVMIAMGGMLRGSEGPILFAGRWIWVDLRGMPMTVNFMTDHWLCMAPAEDVAGRLRRLLDRVATVDRRWSLGDVLGIDREFFAIHAYVDGNGRLGRVLFDASLMLAGYPPRPQKLAAKSLFLFNSAEEAEHILVDGYRGERK